MSEKCKFKLLTDSVLHIYSHCFIYLFYFFLFLSLFIFVQTSNFTHFEYLSLSWLYYKYILFIYNFIRKNTSCVIYVEIHLKIQNGVNSSNVLNKDNLALHIKKWYLNYVNYIFNNIFICSYIILLYLFIFTWGYCKVFTGDNFCVLFSYYILYSDKAHRWLNCMFFLTFNFFFHFS